MAMLNDGTYGYLKMPVFLGEFDDGWYCQI